MSPLIFLALGLTALLALGIPALRLVRTAAADRQHLETALAALRTAGQAVPELALRTTRPGFGARMPRWVQLMLARADVTLQWRVALPAVCVVAALCTAAGVVFGTAIGAAALVAAAAAAVLFLRRLASRRLDAFVEGLPLLLDAIRQLLQVGNSFQQAIVKAGGHASPAVQRHLQLLLRRMQNGAPVDDGLAWLAERLDVPEMHMFAAAVQTNIRHGGRLTNVLASVAKILRDRARVERDLRSSTAETRMSGAALALLPVAVMGLTMVRNPDCITFFTATPAGHRLALAAIGLELCGFATVRRVMRLDF